VTELWAGRLGFGSQQGLGYFLLTTLSRPSLGPTQPPVQWVLGALSPGVKWQGCEVEVDYSSPSSAEVKTAWSCNLTSPYMSSWHGA